MSKQTQRASASASALAVPPGKTKLDSMGDDALAECIDGSLTASQINSKYKAEAVANGMVALASLFGQEMQQLRQAVVAQEEELRQLRSQSAAQREQLQSVVKQQNNTGSFIDSMEKDIKKLQAGHAQLCKDVEAVQSGVGSMAADVRQLVKQQQQQQEAEHPATRSLRVSVAAGGRQAALIKAEAAACKAAGCSPKNVIAARIVAPADATRPHLVEVVLDSRSTQRAALVNSKLLKTDPQFADTYIREALTPQQHSLMQRYKQAAAFQAWVAKPREERPPISWRGGVPHLGGKDASGKWGWKPMPPPLPEAAAQPAPAAGGGTAGDPAVSGDAAVSAALPPPGPSTSADRTAIPGA